MTAAAVGEGIARRRGLASTSASRSATQARSDLIRPDSAFRPLGGGGRDRPGLGGHSHCRLGSCAIRRHRRILYLSNDAIQGRVNAQATRSAAPSTTSRPGTGMGSSENTVPGHASQRQPFPDRWLRHKSVTQLYKNGTEFRSMAEFGTSELGSQNVSRSVARLKRVLNRSGRTDRGLWSMSSPRADNAAKGGSRK